MNQRKANEPGPGDPTPEEIRAACRGIQREWSDRERLVRAGYEQVMAANHGRMPAYTVPYVTILLPQRIRRSIESE